MNTILWNARLIDGSGASPVRGGVVELEADRIRAVGTAGPVAPAGAIDLEGRTLLPGLIDAHAHISSDASRSPGFGPPEPLHGELPRPRELGYFVLAKTAGALLAAGITTVRDVGSYDDEAIVLREAVRLGLLDGPQILSCGRIISATAPGGAIFKTMYREADGADEMRKAVREQLRRGADFIKLMATGARSVLAEDPEPAQMTAEELHAIVDEAHRLGVRVAAHVEGLDGARLAVTESVDTIEHGLSLHRELRLLDQMAQRGIVLVPTLTTFHDLAERFSGCFPAALVDQAKRQREEAYATLSSRARGWGDAGDGPRQRAARRQRDRAGADGRRRALGDGGDPRRHPWVSPGVGFGRRRSNPAGCGRRPARGRRRPARRRAGSQ